MLPPGVVFGVHLIILPMFDDCVGCTLVPRHLDFAFLLYVFIVSC